MRAVRRHFYGNPTLRPPSAEVDYLLLFAQGTQMMRPFPTLFLALAGLAALPSQEVPRVSAEAAASHLVRTGEPVYPAFARAAGLEGVVRFEVGISTYG